ncbi:MAG TPA: 2-amino-4-hydroxy-6-hydroxymethyldihydropteridine diphosphokinase [Gammaproteobacteria bacterium]|nr:2-amino-4-hydroxy-6-hydroxymethyldihydropteridine diphosphokinase [Gammaproteobacteria bacterium]
MKARVYVGMGSNMDRTCNIRSGVNALRGQFGELTLSRVYDSAAVGFNGANFFNLVAGFDSAQSVQKIVTALQRIEAEHGRKREEKRFAPRPLDLDLLLYDNLVLNKGKIHIPRDEILKYAFVLCPLAEIAPQQIHPVTGRSFLQLWRAFDDTGQQLSPVDLRL